MIAPAVLLWPGNGNLLSASPTAGVGYSVGAGGTVTQLTSRTTGVTLNRPTGAITTNNTSLAAGANASFTVTDSAVAINDTVNTSIRSGQTLKSTQVEVTAMAAGSFELTVFNPDTVSAETGAIIINFAVVKGAVA